MRLQRRNRRGESAPRLVVLFSQLTGNGGIQRYNRLLARCLAEYQRHHRIAIDVLSLNDPDVQVSADDDHLDTRGSGGNRARFVLGAVQSLIPRYDLVIVGHVDLGPVALPPHTVHPAARMLTLTHGEEVWRPLPWHKRLALHRADLVWAVSAHTKEEVVQRQGVAANRVRVVPNVLDPDFVVASESAAENPVRSRMLTVSRLTRVNGSGKGVDHVVMALPEIRAAIPDVDFTIVGGGEDLHRLQALAKDAGVGDIVTFAGEVPDQALGQYFRGTDLFVLPSRQEGFGIVFLEAMAHGKPVIAGAHGGSPEVVVDGTTGLLVRYGDRQGLVDAAVRLLRDPERRHAMGFAGARRVRELFHYDRFRSLVFAILEEALWNRQVPASLHDDGSPGTRA
jgi:phosphatidylinositol alpha-1,6-mannosyltransferase